MKFKLPVIDKFYFNGGYLFYEIGYDYLYKSEKFTKMNPGSLFS